MKLKLLILAFSLFLFSVAASATDLYWLSFNDHDSDNCYLMQIDQFGNITVQPKVIFNFHAHSTAIASISASQIVYYANSAGNDDILRTVVDKKTLAAVAGKPLSQKSTDEGGLQVTQGASKFILAFEVDPNTLRGAELSSNGKPNGTSFRLSPRTDAGNDNGGVSADGRMAYSIDDDSPDDKIYLQPLKSNGRPVGDPQVAASVDTDDVDISSLLPNGSRYVVYQNADTSRWFLQVVDGTTGQKAGAPRDLGAGDPNHDDQMVAVDPLGRFVILSEDDTPCDGSSLYYQALDATGNASGPRKLIVGCAFMAAEGTSDGLRGFDILRN